MVVLHVGLRCVLCYAACFSVPIFFFQQPNEESLVPAWMHAIDGCDSQKCDKTVGSCDECTFDSKVFLPCSFVDGFKNEVKSHAAARRAGKDLSNVVESKDGFADPEGEQDDRCGSNWKAATSKELPPASKEAFEQTGVFACLCRHGIVKFVMEFVQSGERYVLFFRYHSLVVLTLITQGQACPRHSCENPGSVWGSRSWV